MMLNFVINLNRSNVQLVNYKIRKYQTQIMSKSWICQIWRTAFRQLPGLPLFNFPFLPPQFPCSARTPSGRWGITITVTNSPSVFFYCNSHWQSHHRNCYHSPSLTLSFHSIETRSCKDECSTVSNNHLRSTDRFGSYIIEFNRSTDLDDTAFPPPIPIAPFLI